LLVLAMALFRFWPDPRLLLFPLLTLLLLITALGVGFWLSALNVEFRDVQHTLPFLTQLWFFLTPVVYPASLVPEGFRAFYSLNPMVGVVEAFRWILLGSAAPPTLSLMVSGFISVVLFVTGLLYFRSRERTFADSLG
jgi:lipopolysaccharide transport system permease protein